MTDEPKDPNKQDEGTPPPDPGKAEDQEERTFTQAELDKVLKERLDRERRKSAEKFADYDTLKDQASKYAAIEEAQKTELQKAQEKLAAEQQRAEAAEAEAKRVKHESAVVTEALQLGFADPNDALAMIGEVEDVSAALKALAEQKPYLLKTNKPAPPGGKKPANPLLGQETDEQRRRRLGLG